MLTCPYCGRRYDPDTLFGRHNYAMHTERCKREERPLRPNPQPRQPEVGTPASYAVNAAMRHYYFG